MKDRAIKIGGRLWAIKFVLINETFEDVEVGAWGYTEYDERTIYVEKDASFERQVDTIIHEILHSSSDAVSEEFVGLAATDIATALKDLGILTFSEGKNEKVKKRKSRRRR